jgi:hypothetical protein
MLLSVSPAFAEVGSEWALGELARTTTLDAED